ncbi:hypothetical protein Q6A51_14460 [Pseudomonas sp. KFB-139]|uniref:Uncharacterized protein n=1 Tax=Pseudomonas serbiensis TaxID=3064350 RepID=A0ABT9CVY9_9PSED|nr:hypothetical protein [Pseudomonas sp. KFB-138]MDO7927995.1 hypothetical protein [Pseudomonas sp. KFB-138]
MLIQDEARLHVDATGAVFKWRYKDRQSTEKLDEQTLRGAKLVKDDYQEPLLALRNRQGEQYKVTDLLPACLPLDKPLRVISSTYKDSWLLIRLAFEGQQRTLQFLKDSDFATEFAWALDQDLLQTVSLSKGKSEFEIKPGDFTRFTMPGAVLSDLTEDGGNYQGTLKYLDANTGRSYSLPCLLPRKQLWTRCIDHFSAIGQVSLPVMAQWSPKQQRYEVTGIDPLLPAGEQCLQLLALKTRVESKPLLLLESPLPGCHGLVFSCQVWVNFIEFEPSPLRPFRVRVEVSEGDGKSRFKARVFEPDTEGPYWADVSLVEDACSDDDAAAQEQKVRIEVRGRGKLIIEQSLKQKQSMYHVAYKGTEPQRVPLVFSTRACAFEYAVDEPGTTLEGVFKVRVGDDSQALYLQLFAGSKAVSDLYYRVELKEWLRFGIAGLREGFSLECVIENQGSMSKKPSSRWHLQAINTDLTGQIMMHQGFEMELKALWNWSCFETPPYADVLPDFYRKGAIVVAQPTSQVSLALFLSPGLLSKAGYLALNEGGSLTLDYVVRQSDDPIGFALVCTTLYERPAGQQGEECRARYVGQNASGEYELELLKPAPPGLAPGTRVNYREYPGQHPLKSIPDLEGAVFVVRLKRFKAGHQVSKVLNVELSVDV